MEFDQFLDVFGSKKTCFDYLFDQFVDQKNVVCSLFDGCLIKNTFLVKKTQIKTAG
jgi:hypothetical protein